MYNGNSRPISIERHSFVTSYVLVHSAQHVQGSCTVVLAALGMPSVCHRVSVVAAYGSDRSCSLACALHLPVQFVTGVWQGLKERISPHPVC